MRRTTSAISTATTLYAGDAAGVRIPPAPQRPAADAASRRRPGGLGAHAAEIERRRPERLALIHFGLADDVERHLAELRERLATWAGRVERGASEEEFVAAAKADLPPAEAEDYDRAMPFWQSYAGLARYWEKQRA